MFFLLNDYSVLTRLNSNRISHYKFCKIITINCKYNKMGRLDFFFLSEKAES